MNNNSSEEITIKLVAKPSASLHCHLCALNGCCLCEDIGCPATEASVWKCEEANETPNNEFKSEYFY